MKLAAPGAALPGDVLSALLCPWLRLSRFGGTGHVPAQNFRMRSFPTCLPVSRSVEVPKSSELGEPFVKASLANTVSGSSRLVPMIGRDLRGVEGWLPIPYEAWPDEGLERGLPRLFAKEKKNWGGQVLEDHFLFDLEICES